MDQNVTPEFSPIERLSRDLKAASLTLSEAEARFLVDAYYMAQANRIRTDHQIRQLAKGSEPHSVLDWFTMQDALLETQIRRALDAYSDNKPLGAWARSVVGIGPVIAAGLLAHIDITRAPTVGHIWRFAGLDPTMIWGKGEKRPWNAELKRLCFLIGESFVKVSGNEKDTYGKVYKSRKELEVARNEQGLFAEQAKAALEAKNFRKDTEARKHYEAGRLPPARIHLRSTRYAVKLFLADYHTVGYWLHYTTLPPLPYAITHLGHAHYFGPPNIDTITGLPQALAARGPVIQREPSSGSAPT
jgi:hypothetical protein